MSDYPQLALTLAIAMALPCAAAGCRHGATKASFTDEVKRVEAVEAVEEYWPNGTIRIRREVVRDADGALVNHGTYTRWHPDGQKEYETTFVMGHKHGTATLWHKNGRKWTEEHYIHGKRHGARCVWDENGVKRKEEHHVDGRPHGTWTLWDKHGKIKWQGSYDHGKPEP